MGPTVASPTSWSATYFDGQTPTRHEASVTLGPTCLYVYLKSGRQLTWAYAELRQSQGSFSGEEICLEWGTDLPESLVIADRAFLAELRRHAPGFGFRFRTPMAGKRLAGTALALGVGSVALLAALYVWIIPWATAQATPLVPVAWEEWLGSEAIDKLAPEQDRIVDARRLEVLQGIVNRLASAAPEAPYDYRLYLLEKDEVNAFALPGGRIVVYSGLLKRTKRPEELAGVLAHEMIHVTHRHSTQALLRGASSRLLLAALTGSDQMGGALEAAVSLGMLHYDREAEAEADREGMALIQRAEIDPTGMVDMMRRLEAVSGELPQAFVYLSDHPDTGDRIRKLDALSRKAAYRPRPLLPGVSWATVAE